MKTPRELAPLLREVASDTGKPFHAVERVFEISMKAFAQGFTLQAVGGRLTAVPHAASSVLPTDLTDQINRHYSDFFDLTDPIQRVVRQITMGDITGKAYNFYDSRFATLSDSHFRIPYPILDSG